MAKGKKTGGRDFTKGDPRAGRKPESEETKLKRRAIKERLNEYLESGEASDDFDNAREKSPFAALEFAMDRVMGKPTQPLEHGGSVAVTPGINWSNLSIDERKRLRELYDKAKGPGEGNESPRQIPS